MSGRFRRTPEARNDLIEIWSFIADHNPDAATSLLLKLDRAMTKLARSPGIGRSRSELQRGIRSFACRPYVIFYTVTDQGIDVIRVLHGARDIEGIFSSE